MPRWWQFCVICVLLECCYAQNETCEKTNVAVIVVASVFGTLAVVLVVLGIVFFLLWKRRRDLLGTPKKTRKAGGLKEDVPSPQHDGHMNPAFNGGGVDLSSAEEGLGGYVRCNDLDTPVKKLSPVAKNDKDKTWTSLPRSDIPGALHRQGSCGSLDDNYLHSMDPEVVSVWLQSQDFIGLGFNISGNMRDGIYVSQVHNRGPAIESGRVKVGDRILSVTISFESMVYEDALTILSYASPYPVKVTLQKEKTSLSDRRLSESNEHLSHPLYRSQSLDALQRIGKDPLFKPKRTFSEMKPETRKDSSRAKKLAELAKETAEEVVENGENKTSTLTRKSNKSVEFSQPDGQVNVQLSDVTVHKEDVDTSPEHIQKSPDFPDIGLLNMQVSFSNDQKQEAEDSVFQELSVKTKSKSPLGSSEETTDGNVKGSDYDSSAAQEFASLMDQMLELKNTERDGESVEMKAVGNGSISSDIQPENITDLNAAQRTPTKPQRKKKPSSTASSTSGDSGNIQAEFKFDVSSAVNPDEIVLEDAIIAISANNVETIPDRNYDSVEEVNEEEITPESCKRDIVIGNDNIQFVFVEREESKKEPDSPQIDRRFLNLNVKPQSQSPEGDPVEEELIEPEVIKRDAAQPPPVISEDIITPELSVSVSATKISVTSDQEQMQKIPQNKVNELDDQMLEQIISMNAHPPGTQGLKWMNNVENQIITDPDSDGSCAPKGGIAFEIRDDIVTGLPRNVALNKGNVARTISHDLQLPERPEQDSRSRVRGGSLREEKNSTSKDNMNNPLEWSGKRLVRSGSFSNIPQDDSISDWTDKGILGLDEDISHKSSDDYFGSDSENEQLGITRSENIFAGRENLANLSDMSDSQSPPSSRTSSPPIAANGQDDSLETSPELSPFKNNNIEPSSVLEKNLSNKSEKTGSYTLTLTVDANTDDDVDC